MPRIGRSLQPQQKTDSTNRPAGVLKQTFNKDAGAYKQKRTHVCICVYKRSEYPFVNTRGVRPMPGGAVTNAAARRDDDAGRRAKRARSAPNWKSEIYQCHSFCIRERTTREARFLAASVSFSRSKSLTCRSLPRRRSGGQSGRRLRLLASDRSSSAGRQKRPANNRPVAHNDTFSLRFPSADPLPGSARFSHASLLITIIGC